MHATPTDRLTKESAPLILDQIDTILFDCDGVLWRGSCVLQDTKATLNHLRSMGKRLFFITNNSTKSRANVKKKFARMGVEVDLEEIITSAFLIASFVRNNVQGEVYVVGRSGLLEEMDLIGVSAFGGPNDDGKEFDFNAEMPDENRKVGAVAIGFDSFFNYTKLAKARHFLQNPECVFIAANSDTTYPDVKYTLPGTGCLVASLQAASNRDPIVIGKPSKNAFEALRTVYPEINPARTLMIGDKMETDVYFGKECGMRTLLVESGVNKESDLINYPIDKHPCFIASDISVFLNQVIKER